MSERENFPQHLCPTRHAAKWKHKTGKEDRWEKEKESHLHSLQLVFCDGGKSDAHCQVGGNEDQRNYSQQDDAALHRNVKEKRSGEQNDRDLDIADQNIRHDFSDEYFAWASRHRKKIFHRAAL